MTIAPPDSRPSELPSEHPSDDEARLTSLERDVARYRVSRDGWTLFVFVFSALAAVAGIVAVGIAMADDGGDGGGAGVAGTAITAEMTEYAFTLTPAQVPAGGTMTVSNSGTMAHTLLIRGTDVASGTLNPGETVELDLSDLEPGTYEVYCDVPGHESSGMVTQLTIGDAAAASGGAHADHEMTPAEGAAMDEKMMQSIGAFPAETQGRGNQPLQPEVLPGGVKRFELTASIIDWEVRPGEVVRAWAYNGMVPGPRIDLDVGDRVQVELRNELPIGTDIHWHGIDVPNDNDGVAPITQELVPTGESYVYEFTVTEPAIGMYHAHAHADVAVPNGLFATLYVGDVPLPEGRTISGIEVPEDLEIAQDLPMVLNDAGVIGLTLDGKSFPATAPIVAERGDWLRLTYFNEGLQVHPMHLHGMEQFVIAKDGEPLDSPYAADTVLVAPGERYTVLVNAAEPGTWVWHCHILNHVESADGMFGMVTALVVE